MGTWVARVRINKERLPERIETAIQRGCEKRGSPQMGDCLKRDVRTTEGDKKDGKVQRQKRNTKTPSLPK